MKTLTRELLFKIKEDSGVSACEHGATNLEPEDMEVLLAHAEATIDLQEKFDKPNGVLSNRFKKEEEIAIRFTEILLRRDSGPDPEWAAEAGAKAAQKLLDVIRPKRYTE